MSYNYPWALLLAVPFLAAIALSVKGVASRSLRQLITASLRALVVLCIAASLAQPYSLSPSATTGITALVDLSSSMSDAQGQALLSRASALAADLNAPLRVVPFAKTTAASPESLASYTTLKNSFTNLDQAATNIENSLSSLRASRNGLAFLLTDGYESTGHSLSAFSSGPLPLVFPLSTDGERDSQGVTISQLEAPHVVKSQQRAEIRTTLSNGTLQQARGTLTVKHGDAQVLSREIAISPSQDVTVSAQSDSNVEGLKPIVATYTWTDAQGSHSVSRSTWLSSEKRDKVLLLSGTAEDDRFLSQILQRQAYQLRSEVAPSPTTSLGDTTDYRAIILNNVAASSLPQALASQLPSFVRSGGGLITVGGDRSYGLGGYIGTQVEEILPVRLVPPHVEKKRLNVAVQLVVDKSRSMAMDERLEFAKGAAREVLHSLKDDDYIGVIGFDDVPFIALPISPVGSVRGSATDRISRLYPTKKTNLFPALDEARRGLARVNAGRKHTIVLTDGKLPDPGRYYFDLVRQMRVLGITVSVVVVGNDADDGFLAQIAELGGGSFYQTADPHNLPKIFLSDVKVASNEKSLKENADIPVSRGPAGLTSTNLSDFPSLRGFVETLSRDGAKTELIVSEGGKSFPLLASWSVEKGKVVSFTSDANGRWSSPWIQWGSINEFWSDVVESTLSGSGKPRSNLEFDLRTWLEGGEVVVDLSIFEETQGAPISASITQPNGESLVLPFSTLNTGHYQARIPKAAPGTYKAEISVGEAALPEIAWDVSKELFTEQPHFKPNMPLLQQIADRSGGMVNPQVDDIKKRLKLQSSQKDLSQLCLNLALLFFVAELLFRECPRLLRGVIRRRYSRT